MDIFMTILLELSGLDIHTRMLSISINGHPYPSTKNPANTILNEPNADISIAVGIVPATEEERRG